MRLVFSGNLPTNGLQVSCVKSLIKAGADPRESDIYGDTPLHIAAKQGHVGATEILLRFGAKTTITNKSGNIALKEALVCKHADTIKALIENESDPKIAKKTVSRHIKTLKRVRDLESVRFIHQIVDPYIQGKEKHPDCRIM